MAFNFNRKIKELQKVKANLPAQIGNIAKRHFLQSFRDGGFTDTTLNPWAKRKALDKSDRARGDNRALLVKTGHLRGSIRVRLATFQRIEIGAYGVPYAKYHNQGTNKLPKRQFIGRSNALDKKIKAKINREFKTIL